MDQSWMVSGGIGHVWRGGGEVVVFGEGAGGHLIAAGLATWLRVGPMMSRPTSAVLGRILFKLFSFAVAVAVRSAEVALLWPASRPAGSLAVV